VFTASNGESALGAARAHKFDVIFCDMKMPGLNGRQIYDRLRAESPATGPRMVFVTGDIINESFQHFLEQERCYCLTKPFALAELSDTIKKVLAGENLV
jgi:CheY-like chemotaxis protein